MSARRIAVMSIMLAGILASIGIGPRWAESKTFNERSLRGTWGFSASGTVGGQPATAVGLLTFDGQGGCETSARLNANGVVIALTSTNCSYTVNADGTGTINSTFAVGSFVTDLVIVEPNKEFHFIISDTVGAPGGTVAGGVAKRQQAAD